VLLLKDVVVKGVDWKEEKLLDVDDCCDWIAEDG